MKTLYLCLYIVAALLFLLAIVLPTPTVASAGRTRSFSLVAAGLFVWVLVDVCRQWDLVDD